MCGTGALMSSLLGRGAAPLRVRPFAARGQACGRCSCTTSTSGFRAVRSRPSTVAEPSAAGSLPTCSDPSTADAATVCTAQTAGRALSAAGAAWLLVLGGLPALVGPAGALEPGVEESHAVGAASVEAAPSEAGCPDGLCAGEVNGTLNTCSLDAPSCVSVMSDDGEHFVAPWGYDGDRAAAVTTLLDVATGGVYEPVGLASRPLVTNGYSRVDAAGYLIKSALSSVTGGPAPDRPQPLRDPRGFRRFDGVLVDRHFTQDGSIYVRIRFGGPTGGDAAGGSAAASSPFDSESVASVPAVASSSSGGGGGSGEAVPPLEAEFMFPQGDNIVTLRCAEAPAPQLAGVEAGGGEGDGSTIGGSGAGRLALSFESGLTWDTNSARRHMELLRKALRWEVVPVVAEFDPQYNNDKPLWFERLYTPFRQLGAGGGGQGAGDDLGQ